jgi:Domain of unknown function (DUF4382)/Domain of unknown function (DUF5666)
LAHLIVARAAILKPLTRRAWKGSISDPGGFFMRKHLIVVTIVMAAAFAFLSCGGSSATSQMGTTPAGSGQLALMGTDAPVCGVTTLDLMITSATLTPQGGGSPVSVIDSSNPVTVDFASLMGFNTLLSLGSVPAGTYSQITFTFMGPSLSAFEGNPPVLTTIPSTLTPAMVTANINPPLQVSANGSSGLTLDFRLFQSVQTNSMGQITGTIDPSIRVTPAVITSATGLGDIDDLTGIVEMVTATSSNSSFTGSFALRVRNTRTFQVNITSNTKFEGVSDLSGLTQGMFVEVDAKVDQDGNIVANDVEAETDTDATKAAFVGPVLSVTRDANGNATELTLFVRAEHPDVSATVPLRSQVTVNLSSTTTFRIATFGADLSAFLFNPSAIARGQHVVVHGPFTGGATPTVTGNMIVLRPQPVMGNALASPAPVIGSDGKTGGYSLAPCNPLFQNQIVNVLTFNGTLFDGLTDLNSLDTTSVYLNRGFLLYTTTSGSLNGLSWTAPPPAYVFPAFLVRKLNLP